MRHGDIVAGASSAPEAWTDISVTMTPGLDASAVNLSFQPISTSLRIGEIFTLTVLAQAGAQPVHAIELHIDLPAGVNVVAPDGAPVEIIEGGTALPMPVMNHVNNHLGTIDYAATYVGTPPSGTFTVATLRLRAGQPVAEMPARFVRMPGRMTDVVWNEESVLGTLGVSWLSASGYSLYLPVIMSAY
jgi:hypothetical protein